jgi:hypothetical protein
MKIFKRKTSKYCIDDRHDNCLFTGDYCDCYCHSGSDEQRLLWKTVQEDVRNPKTPKVIKDYLTNLLDKVNANELEDV